MKTAFTIALLPLAAGIKGPLDTPDLTPYDPVEVLCALGKKNGKLNVQPWCKDWLACIKTKASPAGDPAAVKKAWDPAPCKEICGQWPAVTPKEGAKKKLFLQDANATAALGLLNIHTEGDCLKSCENFQGSLSTCVATIMFEPGKTAAMGIKKPGPKPDAICTKKDSPCMPDLEINHQKCLGHKTKKVLDKGYKIPDDISQGCKMIKMNLPDCKKCPQLQELGQSKYAAFTGGCMDQLNAYHQATHPKAGSSAIPGAKGCKVH